MRSNKYKRTRLNGGKGKFFVIAVIAILLLAGAGAAYFTSKNTSEPATTNDAQDAIDLSPPSKEELKDTEQHKKDLGDSSTDSPPSTVKPMITSSGIYEGSVEVSARVPKVFESNGTCTLRLSKDGRTVTKSREATQNVSEMSCGFITIPTSKLSSGNWSATVSYKSNKNSGQSDPVTIRVD